MLRVYTIGADTHCAFTELAVLSPGGKVMRRERCPTTIRDLYGILVTVRKSRVTVIEEGPLADWLWRGLGERGETVVVCDPRRNQLIAKDSDKDDAIDAVAVGRVLDPTFHCAGKCRVEDPTYETVFIMRNTVRILSLIGLLVSVASWANSVADPP